MDDPQGRRIEAVLLPMDTDAPDGMGVVVAPLGAVSRKDRERAARTSLERVGDELVLTTALSGSVTLQRRADDGSWETVSSCGPARGGRTVLPLPEGTGAHRVLFAPRNENLPLWVSQTHVR